MKHHLIYGYTTEVGEFITLQSFYGCKNDQLSAILDKWYVQAEKAMITGSIENLEINENISDTAFMTFNAANNREFEVWVVPEGVNDIFRSIGKVRSDSNTPDVAFNELPLFSVEMGFLRASELTKRFGVIGTERRATIKRYDS